MEKTLGHTLIAFPTALLLVPLALSSASCSVETFSPPSRRNTGWFHDARWGVMTHYPGTPPGMPVAATPVNLHGEKAGEPLKLKSGELKFRLNPHARASFIQE